MKKKTTWQEKLADSKDLPRVEKIDEKKRNVIDDLTFEIIEQTLVPIIDNLRKAAMKNDKQLIEVAVKLLGTKKN